MEHWWVLLADGREYNRDLLQNKMNKKEIFSSLMIEYMKVLGKQQAARVHINAKWIFIFIFKYFKQIFNIFKQVDIYLDDIVILPYKK